MKKVKQYLANSLLLKSVWRKVRAQLIFNKQAKVARFWHPLIEDYFNGKIDRNTLKPKKNLPEKIIWQYWGQGIDPNSLPPVVRRCFDSVERYKGDYQLIRLDDTTISDYIDLPAYVWQANGELKFPRVFFSDLLRLALLHAYGGVWIDATVLMTAPLSADLNTVDYFVFQRDDRQPNKHLWESSHTHYWFWNAQFKVRMLSSIFFAKKDNALVAGLLDLILYYWKTQHKVIHYFFLQILYHEFISVRFRDQKCPVVSDTLPHILRVLADGNTVPIPLSELLETVNMHKLTYFDDERLDRLDELLIEIDQLQQEAPLYRPFISKKQD